MSLMISLDFAHLRIRWFSLHFEHLYSYLHFSQIRANFIKLEPFLPLPLKRTPRTDLKWLLVLRITGCMRSSVWPITLNVLVFKN